MTGDAYTEGDVYPVDTPTRANYVVDAVPLLSVITIADLSFHNQFMIKYQYLKIGNL